MTLPPTPSQTIGPFFAAGLPWPDGPEVVPQGTPGATHPRIFTAHNGNMPFNVLCIV